MDVVNLEILGSFRLRFKHQRQFFLRHKMSHDPTFAVPFTYNLHVYYLQTLVFTFDIGAALFSYSSLAYTFGE